MRRERRDEERSSRWNILVVGLLGLGVFSVLYVACNAGDAPPTVEQQKQRFENIDKQVEPFHRNLSECAHRTRASQADVEDFLRRVPPRTSQGKCLVACVLRRLGIIRGNKVQLDALMEANRLAYEDDPDTLSLVGEAGETCAAGVADVVDVCEVAAGFNDCMQVRLEHALHRAAVESRMRRLGDLAPGPDLGPDFDEQDIDDALVAALRDEL